MFVLGADIARQCLEAGLVDEIIIRTVRDGTVRLDPVSSVKDGEITVLRYLVRNSDADA